MTAPTLGVPLPPTPPSLVPVTLPLPRGGEGDKVGVPLPLPFPPTPPWDGEGREVGEPDALSLAPVEEGITEMEGRVEVDIETL